MFVVECEFQSTLLKSWSEALVSSLEIQLEEPCQTPNEELVSNGLLWSSHLGTFRIDPCECDITPLALWLEQVHAV